jgi:hypothetical protein
MLSCRFIALSLLLPYPIAAVAQSGVPKTPYTATMKTTRIQKLLDGTTITNITTTQIAQDSQGRFLQTVTQDRAMSEGGTFTQSSLSDPIAHTRTNWNSLNSVATVTHQAESEILSVPPPPLPPPPPRPGSVTPVNGTVVRTIAEGVTGEIGANDRPKKQRENLGKKDIAGISANGIRITTIYPVGYTGNDRPIVVVQELWNSTDIDLMLRSTVDDPRNGQTTTEVTDLQRSEPDPKLFMVPQGYNIRELYSNTR